MIKQRRTTITIDGDYLDLFDALAHLEGLKPHELALKLVKGALDQRAADRIVADTTDVLRRQRRHLTAVPDP